MAWSCSTNFKFVCFQNAIDFFSKYTFKSTSFIFMISSSILAIIKMSQFFKTATSRAIMVLHGEWMISHWRNIDWMRSRKIRDFFQHNITQFSELISLTFHLKSFNSMRLNNTKQDCHQDQWHARRFAWRLLLLLSAAPLRVATADISAQKIWQCFYAGCPSWRNLLIVGKLSQAF